MHTYMVRIEALKLIHFKILPNSELECGCVIWLPKSLSSVARYPQKVANYHRSAALHAQEKIKRVLQCSLDHIVDCIFLFQFVMWNTYEGPHLERNHFNAVLVINSLKENLSSE